MELEKEYLKRLTQYAKVKIVELPEVPYRANDNLEKVKEQEAEKIIAQLPKDGLVILLEEKGTLRDSKNFALLKKFAKTYISNFSDASAFRVKLMEAKTIDELKDALINYKEK